MTSMNVQYCPLTSIASNICYLLKIVQWRQCTSNTVQWRQWCPKIQKQKKNKVDHLPSRSKMDFDRLTPSVVDTPMIHYQTCSTYTAIEKMIPRLTPSRTDDNLSATEVALILRLSSIDRWYSVISHMDDSHRSIDDTQSYGGWLSYYDDIESIHDTDTTRIILPRVLPRIVVG